MAKILDSVDATKKEKFNQKYTRLSEESWTRDNFDARMSEVLNAIDNIEDFITGLQDEIDEIRGDKPGIDSDFEQIKEEWNKASAKSFDDLQSTAMAGGMNPTLRPLKLKQDELVDKLQKINEWKTLQGELSRLAMKNLFTISQGYKEEFVTSEVREKFEEYANQMMEDKVERIKQEIRQDFTRQVADLEMATNAARNEIKNAWKFMDTFADKLDDDDLALVSQEAIKEGFEQFATEDGKMDLSGDANETADKKKEREEARNSAVEESFENDSKSDDEEEPEMSDEMLEAQERFKNNDYKREDELVKHWDDTYSLMDSKEEIAEVLDCSSRRIYQIMKENNLDF